MMNTANISRDFDEIARLSDRYGYNVNRYHSLIASWVPRDAKRVLEIGCGLGQLASRVAGSDRHVTAIDLSHEMIARAQKKFTDAQRFRFFCGDFLEHEFGAEQFDCVVTAATLHHMPAGLAVPRMIDLIKPGGRLIIHDIRRDDGLGDRIRAGFALAQAASVRLWRTGRPRSPRRLRLAWAQHGAGEEYLTFQEAQTMASRFLPVASVFYHWLWRYTIVWDKPGAA
jgi:2-polyprenyl-3-methyl-5-hydroxy-6-metoxy-1,4-benzoquinol methylase